MENFNMLDIQKIFHFDFSWLTFQLNGSMKDLILFPFPIPATNGLFIKVKNNMKSIADPSSSWKNLAVIYQILVLNLIHVKLN